ncbi:MAG: hypothetical protein AMXMBFR75_29250, partial [Candidatus Hinthialibacteria bacterium]
RLLPWGPLISPACWLPSMMNSRVRLPTGFLPTPRSLST